jgi:hypothetical protein
MSVLSGFNSWINNVASKKYFITGIASRFNPGFAC